MARADSSLAGSFPFQPHLKGSCGVNKTCWRFSAARCGLLETISHWDHRCSSITSVLSARAERRAHRERLTETAKTDRMQSRKTVEKPDAEQLVQPARDRDCSLRNWMNFTFPRLYRFTSGMIAGSCYDVELPKSYPLKFNYNHPPSEQRWDAGKIAPGFRWCMMKEIEPPNRSIRP